MIHHCKNLVSKKHKVESSGLGPLEHRGTDSESCTNSVSSVNGGLAMSLSPIQGVVPKSPKVFIDSDVNSDSERVTRPNP